MRASALLIRPYRMRLFHAKLFRIVAGVLLTASLLFPASFAYAATLSFSPASGSHNVGQTFTVTVQASSNQQMNAAGATISFNSSVLSVQSVTDQGGVFDLCAEEPAFSNAQGTVSFSCGSIRPFSGNSTLIRITFRAAGEGSAQVSFSDGSVLAADGQGTDILSNMSSATYQVSGAPAPTPTPTPAATPTPTPATGSAPPAPAIESETHPDEDEWYNESTARVSWNVPSGVNAVRVLLNQQESSTPSVLHSPPVNSRELEDLDDGIWYFHAQFRNNAGFGPVATRAIRIDTAPPEPFDVEVVSEEGVARPVLAFEATDELSGIRHYEIVVGEDVHMTVTPDDMTDGTIELEPLEMGMQQITVAAIDRAGNRTEADSIDLEVTEEVASPRPAVPLEDEGEGFFSQYGTTMFIVFLFLVIAALGVLLMLQKRKFLASKEIEAREAKEIRTTAEKVFSALREEAEDLIASFDNKPGFNPKEKRAIEKLMEAIDISEEMITKEIEDIEKILKD